MAKKYFIILSAIFFANIMPIFSHALTKNNPPIMHSSAIFGNIYSIRQYHKQIIPQNKEIMLAKKHNTIVKTATETMPPEITAISCYVDSNLTAIWLKPMDEIVTQKTRTIAFSKSIQKNIFLQIIKDLAGQNNDIKVNFNLSIKKAIKSMIKERFDIVVLQKDEAEKIIKKIPQITFRNMKNNSCYNA